MSVNNGGLANLSIGQCADERGISRSNVSINQSNIRQLIDRSSSQGNSRLSSFSGARRFYERTVNAQHSAFTNVYEDTPALNTDTEASSNTSTLNPFFTAYHSQYVRTGNAQNSNLSNESFLDFRLVNGLSGFSLEMRVGNGNYTGSGFGLHPSNRSAINGVATQLGTRTYNSIFGSAVWDYGSQKSILFKTHTSAGQSRTVSGTNSISNASNNNSYNRIFHMTLPPSPTLPDGTQVSSTTGVEKVGIRVHNYGTSAGSVSGRNGTTDSKTAAQRQQQNSYSSDRVTKTRSHTTKNVYVTSGVNYSGYTYPSSITTNSSAPTLITLNNNSSYGFSVNVLNYNVISTATSGASTRQSFALEIDVQKKNVNFNQRRTVFFGTFEVWHVQSTYDIGAPPSDFFESGF